MYRLRTSDGEEGHEPVIAGLDARLLKNSAAQAKRRLGEVVSSHTVKYPNSFYALAKDAHRGRSAALPRYGSTA